MIDEHKNYILSKFNDYQVDFNVWNKHSDDNLL
jgi:hypothetical protein